MTNKKKSLHERLHSERQPAKKKYLVRVVETKEAEQEIKQFDRQEAIDENIKTTSRPD
jgi:hypothetical protein